MDRVTMYAIQVQLESKSGEWTTSRQLPTFYLNENVQGIMSEQAAIEIAKAIVPSGPGFVVHVSAVKVDPDCQAVPGTCPYCSQR